MLIRCQRFSSDPSSHTYLEKLRIATELKHLSKINLKISTRGIPFGSVYDAVPDDASFHSIIPSMNLAEFSIQSVEDVPKAPIVSPGREQSLFDAVRSKLNQEKMDAIAGNAREGALQDLEVFKNSVWRQDLKQAHITLLRQGHKAYIESDGVKWKQRSQEYWVDEVVHQLREKAVQKLKHYGTKLATLKILARSCAESHARKRDELVRKSMNARQSSISQHSNVQVEDKATQELELEKVPDEKLQLLTSLDPSVPSICSLNAFLLCELRLFVQNVLVENDPSRSLSLHNIAPAVFEAAKVTARVLAREHRRAFCDFQAESERVRSKSVWEWRNKNLPSPSHVDVRTEKTLNPFCNDPLKEGQSETWHRLFASQCESRDADPQAHLDLAIDGHKLHSLYSKGLNCISVIGRGTRALGLKEVQEHLLSLREKSWLPFLVMTNSSDLQAWDFWLQAQKKHICYYSYFGSDHDQRIIRETLTEQYLRANNTKAHFVLTTYKTMLESIDQFQFDRWHLIVMDEAMRMIEDDHFHDKWCTLLTLPCRQKLLIADVTNVPDVRLMLQFVIPSLFCSRQKLMAWNCAAFGRECVTLLIAVLKKFTIGKDQQLFHNGVQEKTNVNAAKEAIAHYKLQKDERMKRDKTISCEQILAQNIVACHHAPTDSNHKLKANNINRPNLLPAQRPSATALGIPCSLPATTKSVKNRNGKLSSSGSTRKRISRCGKCAGCLSEDCMRCGHCKDMKKYGGPGLRKQSCKYRKCLNSKAGVIAGDSLTNLGEKLSSKCKEDPTPDCKDDEADSNEKSREDFLACSSQESDRDSDSMGKMGDSMSSILNSDSELQDQEKIVYSAELNDDGCSDSYTVGTRMGAGGKMIRTRVMRCGKCIGCRAPDCLKCRHCLDMKKYGGPGLRKQSCKYRKCVAPKIVMLNPAREDEKSESHLDGFRQDIHMTSSQQLAQELISESAISHRILRDLESTSSRNLTLLQECQLMISSKLIFPCSICPACFSSEKQLQLHSTFEHQTSDSYIQTNFATRRWMQKACRMLLQPSIQFGLLSASMTTKLNQEPKGFAKLQGANFCCYLMQPFAILGRLSTRWQRMYQELGISALDGLSGGRVTCHMDNQASIDHRHALIFWDPQSQSFVLKNLSLTAPLFVNGQPQSFSSSPLRLSSRDSIQIGSSVIYFLLPILTSQIQVRRSKIPREIMKKYFYGRAKKRRLDDWKEEAIEKETEMETVAKRRDTCGFSF
uniref:Uncharacterized protein AlNc14C45G3689 n=1 Tax=Albugo laibachii Nc14 TaxID=890382 RepID=F0WAG2_9STRA|nr:conserved hypothetical protein [Albugo laibachii Nc14]|eukprot:CCA18133.1 conserved hypothetical protein [Albugo laibachii Nc14]